MATEPGSDSAVVPCNGCGKNVIVPSSAVRAIKMIGKFITYCSRRCQKRHIATEGLRQQEQSIARHSDPNAGK